MHLQLPLLMQTQIEKVHVLPATTLERLGNLFGRDSMMKLEATSEVNKSEVGSNFSNSFSTNLMFFELELGSIKDDFENKRDLFINESYADYKLIPLTETEKITNASIEAGVLVSEIYLHKDDPIRSYLTDSGKCRGHFSNFDLKGFLNQMTPTQNHILARGIIPKVIVFVFGTGSKNTVFHAMSDIKDVYFDDDYERRVTREVNIISHPDQSRNNLEEPVLERKGIFSDFGTYGLGRIGASIVNPHKNKFYYTFDATKPKYTDVFFDAAGSAMEHGGFGDVPGLVGYSSEEPEPVTPILRRIAKDIITDTLSIKYFRKNFTWWDIYRRIKLSEVGELFQDISPSIFKDLENGVFTNGQRITDSLNSKEDITGVIIQQPTPEGPIPAELNPESILDTTYISVEERIVD